MSKSLIKKVFKITGRLGNDLLLKCDRFNDAHQLLDKMLQPDYEVLANETLNVVFPVLLIWWMGSGCLIILGMRRA